MQQLKKLQEFDKYTLSSRERAMLSFADANGDTVMIEGDKMTRKRGDDQVAFYVSVKRTGLEFIEKTFL